jgi:hypothetical protein
VTLTHHDNLDTSQKCVGRWYAPWRRCSLGRRLQSRRPVGETFGGQAVSWMRSGRPCDRTQALTRRIGREQSAVQCSHNRHCQLLVGRALSLPRGLEPLQFKMLGGT